MSDSQVTWRPVAFDSPSREEASAISQFIRSQSLNPHPEKKESIYWKLCKNEARPGFVTAMVVEPDARIVSTCSVTPKRLWRNGAEILWAEIGDTFTDSGFFRKGMFGTLVNATRDRARSAGVEFVYGLPNNQSLPGYVSKLDFVVKEDLRCMRHVLPLSTLALAARTGLGKIPVVKEIMRSGFVTALSRKASASLIRMRASDGKKGFDTKKTERFGPEFDWLWRRARLAAANAQVRDARYLQWRYEENPFPFVTFSFWKDCELRGYFVLLVLTRADDFGFKNAMIMDWLYSAPAGDDATKHALLSSAISRAIELGADVISALTSATSPFPLPFASFGFFTKPHENPVIFYGDTKGRELLADPSPWHFTLSDTDSF